MCSIADVSFLSPVLQLSSKVLGLVGLLPPVVIDAQWHSRLHEYMQQAILRLPVSLAIASGKAQVASSGGAHSAASSDNEQVLWLVLQESRYDAIASGRLRWEARPRDGTVREINNHLRDPYFDWKLARRGRSVVLQRGMGTGTYRKHADTSAVKIAEVRFSVLRTICWNFGCRSGS